MFYLWFCNELAAQSRRRIMFAHSFSHPIAENLAAYLLHPMGRLKGASGLDLPQHPQKFWSSYFRNRTCPDMRENIRRQPGLNCFLVLWGPGSFLPAYSLAGQIIESFRRPCLLLLRLSGINALRDLDSGLIPLLSGSGQGDLGVCAE